VFARIQSGSAAIDPVVIDREIEPVKIVFERPAISFLSIVKVIYNYRIQVFVLVMDWN